MQDRGPVEDQQTIKNGVLGDLGDQIDQGAAQGNIEHQIGDALVAVLITETLEASAKIFQESHSLRIVGYILSVFPKNVHNGIMNFVVKCCHFLLTIRKKLV